MRTCGTLLLLLVMLLPATAVSAAEHPSLARARVLYNEADYDGAIAAATTARADPAAADAATLVAARAHLERHRLRTNDAADLATAREMLGTVRMAALMPRDQLDLLIGLGQALYLSETFGAAAEMFETALSRAIGLSPRERALLLDWWANAIDREAASLDSYRRADLLRPVVTRMEQELRDDPGNATANYWLAVATFRVIDADRAWHVAVAGWVRARLRPETTTFLRDDIDRLVTTVLIPERVRSRPVRDQQTALAELQSEWEQVKVDWK